MGNILLFKGGSAYNALNVFIDCLDLEFKRLGRETHVVDVRDAASSQKLQDYFRQDCEFALGFNALGSDIAISGKSVYDQFSIPYVALMVDHPIHHFEWYHKLIDNIIVAFADRGHIEFARKYLAGVNSAAFLPQGGIPGEKNVEECLENWEDRDFDLLFIGSCGDPQAIREKWTSFPKVIVALFDEITERLLADQSETIDNAYHLSLAERGYHPSERPFYRFMAHFPAIDSYVRYSRRLKYLETLSSSGLKVACHSNWEEIPLKSSENFKIHPPIDIKAIPEVMRRSKFVLNVMPGYTDGAHERVFTAMLNGAISLSESTPFLRQDFTDMENICFVDYQNLANLADKLKELLKDSDKLRDIALAGGKTAKSKHSWGNRAQRILDLVELDKIHRVNDKNLPF